MAEKNEEVVETTAEPKPTKKEAAKRFLNKKGVKATLKAGSYLAVAGLGAIGGYFIPKLIAKKGSTPAAE